MTDLDIRVRPDVGRDEALAFLRAVSGVRSVHVTLPGETDPELRGLYRLRVETDAAAIVIATLRRDPRIVHVEEPPRRRPRHR